MIKSLINFRPPRRGKAFDFLSDTYFKELKKPNIKINNNDIPNIFNFTHEEMKLEQY
jgi:hypothetical protein